MKMEKSMSARYTKYEPFTMDDLREIVANNPDMPGDATVELDSPKPDPPYASRVYYFEIG